MRSHGGAVTVASTPGKGSSFALYFPAANGKADQEEETAPAQSLLAAGQRVLYVDDEESLVYLAKRVFSRLGHSFSGFTDPHEALSAFHAHPQDYDIVVTDLSMPGMSGFQVAREVLEVRPEIPVLMTTGYVRAEDDAAARDIGVREVMLKPVTVDELGRVFDRMRRAHATGAKPSA
jgi:CheY-like chemotaxis protein